jgi:KaiC/GvpD/RAD55 family RecA-like ATPase
MDLMPADVHSNFSAYVGDASNKPLRLNIMKEKSKVTVDVLFGGSRHDGWAFVVKWLDSSNPHVAEDRLEAWWSWKSSDKVTHLVHLWLPPGYEVYSLNSQFSASAKDNRAYLTFSGVPDPNVEFQWHLIIQKAGAAATTSAVSSSATATSTSGIRSSTTTSTSSAATEAALTAQTFPVLPATGALVGVAVVAAILLVRRKKPVRSRSLQQVVVEHEGIPSQPGISTGYTELDQLLVGGLPEGYSILFLSASWDERDLLLRRIIKSCISTARPVFYVSNDLNATQELVKEYSRDFYAFSDQADKLKSEHGNLFRVPGIGNLSDFSISLSVALKDTRVAPDVSKVLVFDMTSEMLLRHKSSMTLRWLSDFVAKRKTEKYTILATLNPLIAPKEETESIIDLFDGIIQIYEKELAERARRFIVIKKMRGRRYIESDLMLDRNKLF